MHRHGAVVVVFATAVAGRNLVISVPAAENGNITTRAAVENVIAGATGQDVVPAPAVEAIVTSTAVDEVVAVPAGDGVVPRSPGQHVIATRADDGSTAVVIVFAIIVPVVPIS